MASSSSQDNRNFIEEVTKYLGSSMCRETLQQLLIEDWAAFVSQAELSREEEAELRKALMELMTEEDQEKLPKKMQDCEGVAKSFPGVRVKLEEVIRELRALADHIDAMHWGCSVSNVVAASTGSASGLLTLLGLALAPLTGGASLMVSATGLGLGAAATGTSLTTLIVEESSRLSAIQEANRLVSTGIDLMEELLKFIGKAIITGYQLYKNLENLVKHIRAIRVARANPHLLQSALQVRAFQGTALGMTRGARIMTTVTTGAFFAIDLYDLVTGSIHLYEGAKSDLANILRKLAQDMEEKLWEATQICDTLQSNPSQ